ncbi:Fanconi anemia protein FancD2 nuclease-domain-containing protein, partial [Pavlovales sp. CCMP2436]
MPRTTEEHDHPAKRSKSGASLFGDEHRVLVALLARIGVESPATDGRDDPSAAQFAMADALESRTMAQRLAFDEDERVALVGGLKALWDSSEKWLRMCLAPSRTGADSWGESLAKVLLRVDSLQPALVDTLLERVGALASEAFDTDAPLADSTPRLILSHLRWLDALVAPHELVMKLLQVLEVCPPPVQREVIALISEVAEDAQHELVIDTFSTLMVEDCSFTLPVLHALSVLELQPDLAERVMEMLVRALPSAASTDLPALVRALLQSAPRSSVAKAVEQLRTHVRVERAPADAADDSAQEPQLLDAIVSSVQFRREVATALLAEVSKSEGLTALDVWLLCALHSGASTSTSRKLTERAFVKKASSGALSARVAKDAIRGHGPALRAHHRSVLAFAAACVRAAQDSLARDLGCELYCAAFLEFGCASADGTAAGGAGGGSAFGAFYRQELLGALLSHGGSGVSNEVDAALQVMWYLTEQDVEALKPHAALLGTQLDHLDVLSLAQTRRLFAVFGRLALDADGISRGRRGDELSILVRKMLTAVDPANKKRGLAAACAILEQLCPAASAKDADAPSDLAAVAPSAGPVAEARRDIDALLEQMHGACARDWRCAAFMNSELSRAVRGHTLHLALVDKLKGQSQAAFEESHLIDLDTLKDTQDKHVVHGLDSGLVLSLSKADDEEPDDLCLDLFLSLSKTKGARTAAAGSTSRPPSGAETVHSLCSTFDLMCETTAFTDGSLAEVDAMLGCPLLLFAPAQVLPAGKLAELPTEARELVCACLFHAVSWVRTLLNNFSRELVRTHDTETAVSLVARLEALAALELSFEQCAAETPSFVAGLAHSRGLVPHVVKVKGKGGKAKGAASQADEEGKDTELTADGGGSSKPGAKSGGGKQKAGSDKKPAAKKADAKATDGLPSGLLHDWPQFPLLKKLAPLLRPLNLHTSALLALQSARDCDTEGETVDVDASVRGLELSPAAVHLVVTSLHAHLSKLLPPGGRRLPWAAGSAPAADDGDAAAAVECVLSVDDAIAQAVAGMRAFPSHLAALMELIDAGGGPVADGGGDDDDDEEPELAQQAANATERSLERVPDKLQASYAIPSVSAMLRTLRCVLGSPCVVHADSASRAHAAALLFSFAQRAGESGESGTVGELGTPDDELVVLAVGAFGYFEAMIHSLPCGTTAVDLVELLLTIAHLPGASSPARAVLILRVASAVQLPLARSWPKAVDGGEPAKPRGAQITRLFSISVTHSGEPKAILEKWVAQILPQFLLQVGHSDGEGYADTQPLLSTKTIHLFYKPLSDQLISLLKKIELPSAVEKLDEESLTELVKQVKGAIELFAGLISPSKSLDTNSNFIAQILKMSRQFLEVFNRQTMPFFVAAFESTEQREAIAGALKTLQNSTRMIQAHCAQSKASRAVQGGLAQLPHVKKQLELLVFNVRHMLVENECGVAFWMG